MRIVRFWYLSKMSQNGLLVTGTQVVELFKRLVKENRPVWSYVRASRSVYTIFVENVFDVINDETAVWLLSYYL